MATILIATDGSQAAESATALGLEIAQATGDDVLFVSVWDMIRGGIGAPFGYIDQEYVDADRGAAEDVLTAAMARAAKLGVAAESWRYAARLRAPRPGVVVIRDGSYAVHRASRADDQLQPSACAARKHASLSANCA